MSFPFLADYPVSNILSSASSLLHYGVTGLGLLLALLAYLLLRAEQKKRNAHKWTLLTIGGFMFFSILLCTIGVIPEIFSIYKKPNNEKTNRPYITTRLIRMESAVPFNEEYRTRIQFSLATITLRLIREVFIDDITQNMSCDFELDIFPGSRGGDFRVTGLNTSGDMSQRYLDQIDDIVYQTKFPIPPSGTPQYAYAGRYTLFIKVEVLTNPTLLPSSSSIPDMPELRQKGH